MAAECHSRFGLTFQRKLTLAFDGGEITSDAGLLLVREFDDRLGLTAALRDAVPDPRDRRYVTHDVVTLLRQRKLKATAVVLGECSSAALLLFAACGRRLVSPYSTFLFHRMRWQSEKRIDSNEALRWARHFEEMEQDVDDLQVRLFGKAEEQVRAWTTNGDYVTGPQLVAAGLAELLEL